MAGKDFWPLSIHPVVTLGARHAHDEQLWRRIAQTTFPSGGNAHGL